MSILVLDEREKTIVAFARDRRLAHRVLFRHRHPQASPPFHDGIIERLHSSKRALCEITFRGGAKSTIAEEAMIIGAGLREYKHGFIVGASFPKAAERLHAIRREFERNEFLFELFGDLRGQPWGDDKIELSTGIIIQAVGRGQALRGTKSLDTRPDFILVDDLEDVKTMASSGGAEKVQSWFFSDLLPAGDEPNMRVRVLCNDMGVDSLGNVLDRPGSGFEVHRHPWEYLDQEGTRKAIWPQRYPIDVIDQKKNQMYAVGRVSEYNQEYLCRSESPEDKPFKKDMLRVEPTIRNWQPVYCSFDPARTIMSTSAQTGFACWSWIGSRMIIWDAWGKRLLPDQIMEAIFAAYQEYRPIEIGIDEIGLNEWIAQPIRKEQVKRGIMLPVKAVPAPKSKIERIKGLQPYFAAREVTFAKPLPDLENQILGFPVGMRDVMDALANSLTMRPGSPMYEDFQSLNVMEEIEPDHAYPVWLAMNGSASMTVAILLQVTDAGVRILQDWVKEQEPADAAPELVSRASMATARSMTIVLPPRHFDKWHNVGLSQSLRNIRGIETRVGSPTLPGRGETRAYLRRMTKGQPALLVSSQARWTLNGFSGGYCRKIEKSGQLSDEPEDGVYKLVMEAVEAFMGLLKMGIEEDEPNMRMGVGGRMYKSAMPSR